MKKEKFVYNPKTLTFEKYRRPLGKRVWNVLGFSALVCVIAFGLNIVLTNYFPSLREQSLVREMDQMKIKYLAVNEQLEMMSKVLGNIQDRDANVHRMIFGIEPIDQDVWNAGVGGHTPYAELTNYKNSGDLLVGTLQKADQLARQLTLQSRSLDSLEFVAGEKEAYLNAIPSIKPVRSDQLKRKIKYLSGFGMRLHPIHKIPKMHAGLDFTAPQGTPIQATGDGKVIKVRKEKSGYGNSIEIDHGYGYTTLYAHMKDLDVKMGQEVKKGQQIGTVGNTGTSTAPHCHYEIHFKGKAINPIHYCMDGLTPEEYEEMVHMASEANKSFD